MFAHLTVAASLAFGDMIFYAVTFLILMWLIKIFAWKPVNEMMQKRADKISDDIESAEKSRTEAEQLAKQRQDALANSRQEAASILDGAKKQGQQQQAEIVATAQSEAQTLKQTAQKDIEQQRKDALANARNDVAGLSIEIASKIIQKELSAKDQQALVDSYIEGLGKPDES